MSQPDAQTPSPSRSWRTGIFLGAIVLFALLLRTWNLGTLPDGLFRDEAARGYDAYSLLKTGRAAFGGSVMPILFEQHFGLAWVEGLYNYLSVPWVALMGLNVFSTRLTAALAGTATVLVVFFLTRVWFGRATGLVAAALVALSPWHLVFSRIAFRGILLPLVLTLGCWLFITGLKRTRRLVACGVVFGLALHTYSVSRLAVPLFVLVLLAFYGRDLWQLLRTDKEARSRLIAALLLFLLIAGPMYWLSFRGPANARFDKISVFNSEAPLRTLLTNIAAQFSPLYLFFKGDACLRHSLPGFGQILAGLIPFTLLGIGIGFVRFRREWLVPFALFIVGSIPPVLTTDGVPHALRAIGAFPYLEILAAAAIVWLVRVVRERTRPGATASAIVIALILFANAGIFVRAYFGPYRWFSRKPFEYGMQQAVEFAEARRVETGAKYIFLSKRVPFGYIFPLFFAKIDPAPFQESRSMGYWGIADVERACRRNPKGHAIYVASPREVLRGVTAKRWIRDERGNAIMKIME